MLHNCLTGSFMHLTTQGLKEKIIFGTNVLGMDQVKFVDASL